MMMLMVLMMIVMMMRRSSAPPPGIYIGKVDPGWQLDFHNSHSLSDTFSLWFFLSSLSFILFHFHSAQHRQLGVPKFHKVVRPLFSLDTWTAPRPPCLSLYCFHFCFFLQFLYFSIFGFPQQQIMAGPLLAPCQLSIFHQSLDWGSFYQISPHIFHNIYGLKSLPF